MKVYERSPFNILKLNSENWLPMEDLKTGDNLSTIGTRKGNLITFWKKKQTCLFEVHLSCKNV